MYKPDSSHFRQFKESLFSAYTETIEFAPSFRDNIFEYFVDFANLLEKYGFKTDPTDSPLCYQLNAEPFDYFVVFSPDEFTFRLYYRMINGNKCFSELTERFDRTFIYFRNIDEIYYRLTLEIGRLILSPPNSEDAYYLLNRKLTIKQSC